MKTISTVSTLVSTLQSEDTPSTLRTLASEISQAGMNGFCLVIEIPSAPGKTQRLMHCSDAAWISHYREMGFSRCDPILLQARRCIDPFTWRKAVKPLVHSRHGSKVMQHAQEFGYQDGLTISEHLPCAGLAVISLTAEVHSFQIGDLESARLNSILKKFSNIVRWFVSRAQPSPAVPALNPRECQALALSARGMSSPDVAVKMHLSDATVRFHLQNAKKKLGCSNKTQAVVEAFRAGLIRL